MSLLYVALTRAKYGQVIILSGKKKKSFSGLSLASILLGALGLKQEETSELYKLGSWEMDGLSKEKESAAVEYEAYELSNFDIEKSADTNNHERRTFTAQDFIKQGSTGSKLGGNQHLKTRGEVLHRLSLIHI